MSPEPRPHEVDGRIHLKLHVNGTARDAHVQPWATLLDVLNRTLRLTGTREGCGVGMCGACTVLADGEPMSACLLLAFQAEGREIVTVEGLVSARGELDPVQQAFVNATGFQCSYCTPGFLLATKALLEEFPETSRAEAAEYLSGNLCRCGSYVKILDAVMGARKRIG
jgi:aerobic-type carbon monoxide dehydrogenase small subunit (CoxS/CutS family)